MGKATTLEQFIQLRSNLFQTIQTLPNLPKLSVCTDKKIRGRVSRELMLQIIALCKKQGFKPYQKIHKCTTGTSRFFTKVLQSADSCTNFEMVLYIFRGFNEDDYTFTITSVVRAHQSGYKILRKTVLLRLHDFS